MADLIEWDDELSVGVDIIDNQHKKIFSLINALNRAQEAGMGHDVIDDAIFEMIKYARIHFTSEEVYFDKYKYPSAKPHKVAHELFIKKVLEFKEMHKAGNLLCTDIIHYLNDWWIFHIKQSDQRYSTFLVEHLAK